MEAGRALFLDILARIQILLEFQTVFLNMKIEDSLLGAKGIATRSKKLLGAPGLTTRSKVR